MRGAVTKLKGVSGIDIAAGSPNIVVHFDPKETSAEEVLAGMKASGQGAKARSNL